ncbi:hypothetical protein KFK09_026525 [Dendrobium nobile]|uniref:Uncharacterized protein n=1 Tax=Dendrobium nobile TaxID=94219 RepID=A0A8T3A6R9_DENNO|nr:hypothetical protein KFK09_026525 [Dendrobium nobile]
MVACDFNMYFTFATPRWEGSAYILWIDHEFEENVVDENFVHPETHQSRVVEKAEQTAILDVDVDLVDRVGENQIIKFKDNITTQLCNYNR